MARASFAAALLGTGLLVGKSSAFGIPCWCPPPAVLIPCCPPPVILCPPVPNSLGEPAPTPHVQPDARPGSDTESKPRPAPKVTPETTPTTPATPTPADPDAPKPSGVKPADLSTPKTAIPEPASPPDDPTPKGFESLPQPKPLQIPSPEPAKPDLKIPSLKPPLPGALDPAVPPLSIPMNFIPNDKTTSREAKSSPIHEPAPLRVDVFEVEGQAIASPTARKKIGFFNQTDRAIRLKVGTERVTLPAHHHITAEAPAAFQWTVDDGETREVKVPVTAPGLDIVLREKGK